MQRREEKKKEIPWDKIIPGLMIKTPKHSANEVNMFSIDQSMSPVGDCEETLEDRTEKLDETLPHDVKTRKRKYLRISGEDGLIEEGLKLGRIRPAAI